MPTLDELLGLTQVTVTQKARRAAKPIPAVGDVRHARKAAKRQCRDLTRFESAYAALGGLPAAGESWHCLMDGSYDGFDLVDAIIDHAGQTVETLHLATLGFAERNATRLFELLDAGTVKRATLIVSQWYEADKAEAHVVARLAEELPRRGGWFIATRCHAKILAFRFADGCHYVAELSANLRTCRSIEQFVLTHDRELFDFHASWMETVASVERDRPPAA